MTNTPASSPSHRMRHIDGWHVTPQATVATIIVALPATIIGFLFTLSIWFMSAGIPLLVGGCLSIRGVLHSDRPGASHPAVFVSSLAVAESTLGIIALRVLTNGIGEVVATALILPAGITGLVANNLRRQTTPLTPPPPSTRHRADSHHG